MSIQPRHFRIFLASPGDVPHERELALTVLDQLSYEPAFRGRITIEEVAWDKKGAGAPILANLTPQDSIEKASCRPDFAILCYPVISFITPYVHRGSMRNLLGDNPDPKLAASLSNETQVTPQTPPTFLFHTTGDTGVPPENSVLFYMALRKAGVPAEMHIYERGEHGVGLALFDPILSSWPGRLEAWMRLNGWMR